MTLEHLLDNEREQGHAEGRAEGQAAMQEIIAKKMIVEGLTDDVIAKLTGLSEKKVIQLRTTDVETGLSPEQSE